MCQCTHHLKHFVLAGSMAPYLSCFPSSLGKWFTFRFPTRHLVSTEWAKDDQRFSILSWTTPSFSCDGEFDQVVWVGHGPGSSHWMSGMLFSITCVGTFHMKGRYNITKVGDAVAKLEKWVMVKEFDLEKVAWTVLQDSKQPLSVFRNLELFSFRSWMLRLT